MTKNILVINPFGIGDVLFSTPLVCAIKRSFPKGNIAYICNIRTKEILETNPDISEVFVFERGEYRALWKESKSKCIKKIYNFWKEIKERHFGIVFDLSLGKEYAFFSWLIGIKDRRGFNYKGRGRFLTKKIPFDGFNDKPIAEYYMDLIETKVKSSMVLVPLSEEIEGIDRFLKQTGVKEQDILVGIAPGGGASFGREKAYCRRWPWQRFAELIGEIGRLDTKIILLWGPGEEELVKNIQETSGGNLICSPGTSVREMAALMKRCRLVVCNDGGMLHIAVSQYTPTIAIFGPIDEKVYGPYPPSDKHIVVNSTADCRPCYRRFKLPDCDAKKCMEAISVEIVFSKVVNSI